jgi:hypothetical protein
LPIDDKFCTTQCQLHAGNDEWRKKVDMLIYGTEDKDGLLVKMGKLIESFQTVRLVVYSCIGIILTSFIGAMIALVLRSTPK